MRKDTVFIKPHPITLKRYFWLLLGAACVLIGLILCCFFEYRKNNILLYAWGFLIFGGWGSIIYNIFPNFFHSNKTSAKMVFAKIVASILWSAISVGSISYVIKLGEERKSYILKNGPTLITTGYVESEEMRGKHKSIRFINVKYFVNKSTFLEVKKDIDHEFKVSHSYKIKYSVEHPTMFEIYK